MNTILFFVPFLFSSLFLSAVDISCFIKKTEEKEEHGEDEESSSFFPPSSFCLFNSLDREIQEEATLKYILVVAVAVEEEEEERSCLSRSSLFFKLNWTALTDWLTDCLTDWRKV